MNRQAAISGSSTSITSVGDLIGMAGRSAPNYEAYASSILRTPEPQAFPKRVYRVTLTRGVQEFTCTHVATDEGFLKFYNHVITQPGMSTCSVVAMIPAASVQLVTSILEADQVVV